VPLVHLHELGDGVTQKQLAARVGLDGSSLVRLLDILSRQGLLERRTDTSDARARLVFLTEAGRERVDEIRKALVEAEAEMLQDISDAELASMLEHFSLIEERLQALQARTKDVEPS
jgi:MarR family transcriptional regulator for hemolysin